jgi:TolB protein
MIRQSRMVGVASLGLLLACQHAASEGAEAKKAGDPKETDAPSEAGPAKVVANIPGEKHLANVRELTFGGENAEAYFSPDGKELIFQSTRGGYPCDQMFVMSIDGTHVRRVSTGTGTTTCGYFFPDGQHILFASSHLASPECPPKPDYSHGYVWALRDHEIFIGKPDGSELRRLTQSPGYDAEATISPDGKWIVFTSTRDGDLELYKVHPDGSGLTRLTHAPGYDGGAFFSHDGKRLVYRAARAPNAAKEAEAHELLMQHLVRPTTLDIYVMDADGSNQHQVTHNGAANFGPYFFPDDHRIIYASNVGDPTGRNFDLYMIRDDGTGEERITFNETFDGFPMFSPDGKQLVFASNRFDRIPHETNIFIADWVE